jgi:hypothetical protein
MPPTGWLAGFSSKSLKNDMSISFVAAGRFFADDGGAPI